MKKLTSILTVSAFLLVFFGGAALCQQGDLTGTWEGETMIPDEVEPDKITLVLQKTDGEYKGRVTDAFGYAMDAELEDVKLENNKLSAHFYVFTGEEYMKVTFTLTVEGDTMKGEWKSADGDSAPITLKRKQ